MVTDRKQERPLHKTDSAPGRGGNYERRKLAAGAARLYQELFILRFLFTDASHDTSQLRGFASAVLGNNAQLTMKGILPMDGRLLIRCFYGT